MLTKKALYWSLQCAFIQVSTHVVSLEQQKYLMICRLTFMETLLSKDQVKFSKLNTVFQS